MKKNKAFTLIELIAVLVILAVIALIVTPLVLNIIRKVRLSADKRSIDAYGRSIEIAISAYLLDTGNFPTNVSQLTVEYSSNEVVCSTTQINSDLTVYLTGCTVAGRNVDYTYGISKPYQEYNVGDVITYNNINYYVIKKSGTSEEMLTVLKADPLTTNEVNTYGVGHINRYTYTSAGTVYDLNGYGAIAYYSSETCGFVNNTLVSTECTTDYDDSDVKYVVDAWKTAKAPNATEARLIMYPEYTSLTRVEYYVTPTQPGTRYVPQYDWLYNSKYRYWTKTQFEDWSDNVWYVHVDGDLTRSDIHGGYSTDGYNFGTVRPVITLSKTLISA